MSDLDKVFERLGKIASDIEHTHELTERNYKRTGELFDRTDEMSQTIMGMQVPLHDDDHTFIKGLQGKLNARTAFWNGLRNKLMEKGIMAAIGFALLAFGIGAWQMFKDKLN